MLVGFRMGPRIICQDVPTGVIAFSFGTQGGISDIMTHAKFCELVLGFRSSNIPASAILHRHRRLPLLYYTVMCTKLSRIVTLNQDCLLMHLWLIATLLAARSENEFSLRLLCSLIKSWLHISLVTFVTLLLYLPVLTAHQHIIGYSTTVHPRYGMKSLPLSKLLLQLVPINIALNLTSLVSCSLTDNLSLSTHASDSRFLCML